MVENRLKISTVSLSNNKYKRSLSNSMKKNQSERCDLNE